MEHKAHKKQLSEADPNNNTAATENNMRANTDGGDFHRQPVNAAACAVRGPTGGKTKYRTFDPSLSWHYREGMKMDSIDRQTDRQTDRTFYSYGVVFL